MHTVYEPDCDFEDGLLIERNLGTRDHSAMQAALGAYLFRRRKAWQIHGYMSLRIRIRAGKYMIPDLCIVAGAEPTEQVLQSPPLLVIEILSPDDRMIRVDDKVQQWLAFGVPYVWVIDPETLESELHHQRGRARLDDGVLRIPETLIEVPLALLDEE